MYAVSPRVWFSILFITADMVLIVRSADMGTWKVGTGHNAIQASRNLTSVRQSIFAPCYQLCEIKTHCIQVIQLILRLQYFFSILSRPKWKTKPTKMELNKSDPFINLLEYWESQSASWPRLSVLALGLLGVPASSTSSERTFSLAGRTLEDRRSQLSGDTVDGLLFLHGLQIQK
jgi:hAT family C-terminal dimerisation region